VVEAASKHSTSVTTSESTKQIERSSNLFQSINYPRWQTKLIATVSGSCRYYRSNSTQAMLCRARSMLSQDVLRVQEARLSPRQITLRSLKTTDSV